MRMRVDKCKSFVIKKASTCSTHFQPKLFVNGERVKPVERGGGGVLLNISEDISTMIWIIQNTKENFFRRLQRYSTSSIVYLYIQGKVNDIFALLVKQDLLGPHNGGPRCYLEEKYTG